MVLQFTIDHNKIDADLTHFPFTLILNSDNAKNVFETIGDNYKKMKVSTDFNGANELFVEVEYWNADEQRAVLHVSRSDWVISSNSDTSVYLHYGATLPENYHVGDTGSVVAQNVWDSNYVMVQHMGNSLTDSTSNGNDGTNSGTTVVDFRGSKGRSFNGTSDYITWASNGNGIFSNQSFTNQFFHSTNSTKTYQILWSYDYTSHNLPYYAQNFRIYSGSDARFAWNISGYGASIGASSVYNTSNTFFTSFKFTSGAQKIIVNNTTEATGSSSGTITYYDQEVWSGKANYDAFYSGVIGEVRISDVSRSDSWIKAEYYSLFNQLVKDVIPSTKPRIYYFATGESVTTNNITKPVETALKDTRTKTINIETGLLDSVTKNTPISASLQTSRSINKNADISLWKRITKVKDSNATLWDKFSLDKESTIYTKKVPTKEISTDVSPIKRITGEYTSSIYLSSPTSKLKSSTIAVIERYFSTYGTQINLYDVFDKQYTTNAYVIAKSEQKNIPAGIRFIDFRTKELFAEIYVVEKLTKVPITSSSYTYKVFDRDKLTTAYVIQAQPHEYSSNSWFIEKQTETYTAGAKVIDLKEEKTIPLGVSLSGFLYIQSRNIEEAYPEENKVLMEDVDIYSIGDEVIIGDETTTTITRITNIEGDYLYFDDNLSEEQLVGGVIRKSKETTTVHEVDNEPKEVYIAIEPSADSYYQMYLAGNNTIINGDTTANVDNHCVVIKKLTYSPKTTLYAFNEEVDLTVYAPDIIVTKTLNFIKQNFRINNTLYDKFKYGTISLQKIINYKSNFEQLSNIIQGTNYVWNIHTLTSYTFDSSKRYQLLNIDIDSTAEAFLNSYSEIIPIIIINNTEYRGRFVLFNTEENINSYINKNKKEFVFFRNGTECYVYIPQDYTNKLDSIVLYGR